MKSPVPEPINSDDQLPPILLRSLRLPPSLKAIRGLPSDARAREGGPADVVGPAWVLVKPVPFHVACHVEMSMPGTTGLRYAICGWSLASSSREPWPA